MIINLSKIDFGGVVTGGKSKPEEVFDVQPTTTDQTITPTEGSVFSGGTVRAVTSDIDNNIVSENIKEGVTILGVEGSLKEETGVFVVPPQMRFGYSTFTKIPSNYDFRNFSNVVNIHGMFSNCKNLTTIPQLDTSKVTNMEDLFYLCKSLANIPQLDTSKVTTMFRMFNGCSSLTSIPRLDTSNVSTMNNMFTYCSNLKIVEGIDFSGLTSSPRLFGSSTSMPNLTRFIVNGKINVSISDNYSIKALTAIDYDSVKSILTAADRTDNTNAKTLTFNRTMTDQNGELAALVASCTSKGWTISGLTLQ